MQVAKRERGTRDERERGEEDGESGRAKLNSNSITNKNKKQKNRNDDGDDEGNKKGCACVDLSIYEYHQTWRRDGVAKRLFPKGKEPARWGQRPSRSKPFPLNCR